MNDYFLKDQIRVLVNALGSNNADWQKKFLYFQDEVKSLKKNNSILLDDYWLLEKSLNLCKKKLKLAESNIKSKKVLKQIKDLKK